jgi:hypothetical protein
VGNRSLNQTKLRRNNTSESVIDDPGIHSLEEAKTESSKTLENILGLGWWRVLEEKR